MKTTRDRCLRVRVSAQEETAIYSRFPRRQVPGLVRAWLLLEAGDKPPLPARAKATEPLLLGRILVHLQAISRRIDGANLTPVEEVKLQGILLAILEEMERHRDD